jgi:serine/threonine protein kinase
MVEIPKFLQAKYDNVEFIDHGAHGRVYKCTRAEAVTAVKVLDALDSESQKRFRSEVDILRRIDHKNVLKVLGAEETDGYYWYESDFASEGHFGQMAGYLFYSDLDRVNYFSQICSGVQALHDLNPPIIHRDLKSSNILAFLDPEQRTVLKNRRFWFSRTCG